MNIADWKFFIIFSFTTLAFTNSQAQWDSILPEVQLSEVQVKKGAFTVEDFIRMTKTDTSFYRAFKNLKMFPHESKTHILVKDKKGGEKAELNRIAKHFSDFKKGWIQILKESTEGKMYKKNGEHKFFTAEMYDKVFFPKDTFTVNNIVGQHYQQNQPNAKNKTEKYYEQLKTFMFSPGTGVDGVPLIGKKLEIFDGEMRKYYDYTIEKVNFQDSLPCYKFKVQVKNGVRPDKVVIKNLITYYDRRTMEVIARAYKLSQTTLLFDFDIQMYIQLKRQYNEYLPTIIRYNGSWDVPTKKPENIQFEMLCSQY